MLARPPRVAPSHLLGIWLGLGMATVLFPLVIFMGARATNSFTNNQWQNENNSGDMEAKNYWWNWGGGGNEYQDGEAAADGEEDANGNDDYNENNGEAEDMEYSSTSWWQWGGRNQNNDSNDGEGRAVPWWYWSGHQGEGGEEDLRAPPVLIAAFMWSLLVFFSILFFGFRSLRAGKGLGGFEVPLIMFACYCVLSMFLFSSIDGAVSSEGRVVEEHGFLGQLGVLVYITSFLWLAFSVGFIYVIRRQAVTESERKLFQREFYADDDPN